jgi:hypothetical protein
MMSTLLTSGAVCNPLLHLERVMMTSSVLWRHLQLMKLGELKGLYFTGREIWN